MTKKDLKTGMVVKVRNGYMYTVMLGAHATHHDADVLVNLEGGYMRMETYGDDLEMLDGNHAYDIMEVYEGVGLDTLMCFTDCPTNFRLLWKRTAEHTPEVGDVYDAGHSKFVVTHKGTSKYLAIMWVDGSCGERTLADFKSLGYKFTGKNLTKFVDILTNEVKDC